MPARLSQRKIRLNARAVWDRLDLLNMPQNELARRAGVTSGYLSLLLGGRRCPSPEVRQRLMDALGVTDFHDLFIVEESDGA